MSGAKGVHAFLPVEQPATTEAIAAATRALPARAERIDPELATTPTCLPIMRERCSSQHLPPELVEEGRAIPVVPVAAMHESKRRVRSRRREADGA